MSSSEQFLTASEAAMRLGVSPKALRLYEARGLVTPVRTAAGWRTYGPAQMVRGREIAALRALGLSLAQVREVLGGQPAALATALEGHLRALEGQMQELTIRMGRVRELRSELALGQAPLGEQLVQLADMGPAVSFALPWPWGGERFELTRLGAVTWLTGPLGSGKTRLAEKLAAELPGAGFLPLDRAGDMEALRSELQADSAFAERVRHTLDWLTGDGARETDALLALVAGLERPGQRAIVVDLVEHGLDQATQEALAGWLRGRAAGARPLLLMTRSSAMLDLEGLRGETIIYCPANHAPPLVVHGHAGAPGLELVASCLATPEVRARTQGTAVYRPAAAKAGRVGVG